MQYRQVMIPYFMHYDKIDIFPIKCLKHSELYVKIILSDKPAPNIRQYYQKGEIQIETITSKNLLDLLKAYFDSLGLSTEADNYFTGQRFVEGLVLKLPSVCIVPKNKPIASKSKQTHIHVTGNNRYFFYSPEDINSVTISTKDRKQPVIVSSQNIKSLSGKDVDGEKLLFEPSFTMTKIACRTSQESQVQISKIKQDGEKFIELRNNLYENDILVFLKQRMNDTLVVVGIPKSFYQGKYEIATNVYSGLECKGTITVKNALNAVIDNYDETDIVNSDDAIYDAIYQEIVNDLPINTSVEIEKYEAIEYQPTDKEKLSKSNRPNTNPVLGKEAIRRNQYCCAVDSNHKTFIKKNGERYMEAHHLIPLEKQKEFTNKLDTIANIVPLCPLCHKLLHHGKIEDIKPIITQLFIKRQEALKQSGLEITLEALIKLYE